MTRAEYPVWADPELIESITPEGMATALQALPTVERNRLFLSAVEAFQRFLTATNEALLQELSDEQRLHISTGLRLQAARINPAAPVVSLDLVASEKTLDLIQGANPLSSVSGAKSI